MPGLRVWRPDGVLSFDGSASLLRFIGWFAVTTPIGSYTDPALADGRPWVFARGNGVEAYKYMMPGLSISGTTISWSGGQIYQGMIVFYGVY